MAEALKWKVWRESVLLLCKHLLQAQKNSVILVCVGASAQLCPGFSSLGQLQVAELCLLFKSAGKDWLVRQRDKHCYEYSQVLAVGEYASAVQTVQRNVPIKCSMETAPVEKAAACWHRGSCCAFATRVQCWLMVSLVATRSPRSFPAELHLSESGPLWTCARDYSCLGAELGVPCYWTHDSPLCPLPQPVQDPLKSSIVLWGISHSSQFLVICKLAKLCTLSWHVGH